MRLKNYELKPHTTFKVGGKALWALFPETKEELKNDLVWIQENQLPFKVMGNGSNLLVSDKGYNGAVIFLKNMKETTCIDWLEKGKSFIAGACKTLKQISQFLVKENCPDFIAISTIPGTLGGAIKMNAGCFGREIKDFLLSVNIVEQDGTEKKAVREELGLSYRNSNIKDNQIILNAEFQVKNKAEKEEIEKEIFEIQQKRKKQQPIGSKNAGSIFKNGKDYFAAKLIDDAGLKGLRIGDAEVSKIHANYIVNKKNATAQDIYQLILEIEKKIFQKYGIQLQREIELIGDFS